MATAKKHEPEEPEEPEEPVTAESLVEEPEIPQVEELAEAREPHYPCTAHERFFPREDPERPMSEFSYDRDTRKRRFYCQRCDNENKRQYSQRQREDKQRPPLDRNRDAQAKMREKLKTLIGRGQGQSREVGELRYELGKLQEREQELLGR